ncbi:hypothetical protein [Kitasatospora sp. NPDC093806]|uniref:hypothetical protein n=1 Tax=Kitasatospora sp. NPDC093806 TaxID=3155075 RepID=UPI003430F6C6
MHPRHLWKRLTGAVVRRGIGATVGALALVAAFVLTGTAASTSNAAAQPAGVTAVTGTPGQWACSGAAIPDGWVLTAFNKDGCSGWGSWYQRPAADGLYTCGGSPIVSGYVTTDYIKYGCNGMGSWRHNLVSMIWRGSPGLQAREESHPWCGGAERRSSLREVARSATPVASGSRCTP